MADKSPSHSRKLVPLPPIRSSSKKSASPSSGVKNVQTIQKIYEEASNEEEADVEVEIRKPSRIGPIFSKSAYFNLQRNNSVSGDRIDKLKEAFQRKRPKSEGNLIIAREVSIDAAIKEAFETAASKTKTSADLKSPNTKKKISFTDVLVNPKEPVPSPRKSLENLKKFDEKYERDNPFISAYESSPTYTNKWKEPLRNPAKAKEVRIVKVKFDTIQYAEPESRNIIVRQDSVDSINLIQEGLSIFEMDDKKLGRRRSFKGIRNLFTSKSKKKEDEVKDNKKNQNAIVGENYENENFNRASPMRQTAESSYQKNCPSSQSPGAYQQNGPKAVNANATQAEIENNFAQMHLHKYTEVKKRFINGGPMTKSPEEYVCMDSPSNYREREPSHNGGSYISDITKNHDTCSSNTDSETTSGTYENALIAQAEMLHRRQVHQQKPMPPPRDYTNRNKYLPGGNQLEQFSDRRTDTPPRAQETYQNLELIKPRASIPINSERPLPNPYTSEENSPFNKTIERNLNNDQSAKFSPKITASNAKEVLVNDIYGTVYDAKLPSSSRQSSISGAASPTNFTQKSPSKLKLPANREKVELVPRMKSPIPQSVVSTDKIIATELLKNKKGKEDKANISTHQNLSIEIDYPLENAYYNSTVIPCARQDRSLERNSSNNQKQISTPQKIPNNIMGRTEMIPSGNTPTTQQESSIANVMMADVLHSNANHSWSSQHMQQQISPYYSPIPTQDRRSSLSLSPSKRFSPSPLTKSPSKQEIRQSVEAFCWKEIKKLKDKQEEHLFGTIQVPDRISRSMSVNTERGRRSLSLPREMPKARRNLDMYQQQVLLQMPVQQAVIYEVTPSGQYFVRNSPQRRTIESMHKSSGHLHNQSTTTKPIFNRGSLQQHTLQPYGNSNNADYNKKVSFINSQTIQQSWPTKNGYVQSPPQRRLDTIQRMESMEDDVFLAGQHDNMRSNTRPPSASNPHHQQQQIEHQRRMFEQHLQQQQQQLQQESMYGQVGAPQQHVRRLTLEEMHYLKQQQINQEPIYGRRQVAESLYGRTVAPVVFDLQYGSMQRRKLLEPQEPIYGARYGTPVLRTVTDSPSRMIRPVLPPPITLEQGGYVRQVRVNNKECDIYGQIHEKNKQLLRNAQVQQSGVMYGLLQRNANAGPMQHKSYNQLIGTGQQQQQGFVRNSRLTASANDMHRNVGPQYQRPRNNETKHLEDPIYGQQATAYYDHQPSRGPIRPLPSVPNNRGPEAAKHSIKMMPNEAERMYNQQQKQQQQEQQVPKKGGSIKKSKVKSGK